MSNFENVSKKVGAVTFSLVSPEQIKKMGVAKIVTPELYDMGGYPVDGGLMDLRLGAIDPGIRCRTCGGKLKECLGHFGYIELARPTMHVKYVPMMELLLRSTCQECGRILLNEENIKKHKKNLLKKAKDVKKCPWCKAEQEKVKVEKPTTFMSGKKRIFPSEGSSSSPSHKVTVSGTRGRAFSRKEKSPVSALTPPKDAAATSSDFGLSANLSSRGLMVSPGFSRHRVGPRKYPWSMGI